MSFHAFCLCHLADAKRRLTELIFGLERHRLIREHTQRLEQRYQDVLATC